MGTSTVKSPWDSSPDSPRRGTSPGANSSPSNAPRSDSGYPIPPIPAPVVGGEGTVNLERALAQGMKSERR